MTPLLSISNISTGYGKKQVLYNISMEVKQGEIILVAGNNGSGKSTLLKAIYGILPLWEKGQIIFNEENITGKNPSTLLKKGLLYIPQKNNLFEDLSVIENLEMAGLTLNRGKLKQGIEHVLSIFTSLSPHLHRTPMKLSGGERQLLSLAMATLHEPKMILLDEPLNGLSNSNLDIFINKLKKLNSENGISIIMVEHRIKEALILANRVCFLKLGKVSYNESVCEAKFDIVKITENFS